MTHAITYRLKRGQPWEKWVEDCGTRTDAKRHAVMLREEMIEYEGYPRAAVAVDGHRLNGEHSERGKT